jgi:transcription elongation factor Elf1
MGETTKENEFPSYLDRRKSKKKPKRSLDQTFFCDICGSAKKSKRRIKNHVESHLNLTCDACKAVIKTRGSLPTVLSSISFESLRLLGQLLNHLSRHFNQFTCDICGQTFNHIGKFKNHLRKLHDPKLHEKKETEEKGKFPCRFCPYVLNNRVSLAAHEYRLHKDGKCEVQFTCIECGAGFYTKEEHRLHGFEHFKGEVRHCDFPGCGRFFRSGRHLGIHKQIHLPPKFECKNCGAVS